MEDTVSVWGMPQAVQFSETFQGPGGPRRRLTEGFNSSREASAIRFNCKSPFMPENKRGCRLVPDQDIHFFYTRSHFIALQNCVLIFPTNSQFFSHLKNALQNLVIELCIAIKIFQKYFTIIYQIHAQFCSYWIIDFFQ